MMIGMLVLGHRGASAAAPENSPAAFRLADQMGADGVELDVRMAPDGRLLVAHDPLPTSTDEVEAMGLATFDEVLDACGDRLLVNVEIKTWPTEAGFDPAMSIVDGVVETLRRRGQTQRWLISCFHWETLQACRAAAPEIATAWLVKFDDDVVERTASAGHSAVHPRESLVTAALVERAHRSGLAVNVWTCNDPARIVALSTCGVDGVCTDVPDVALDALDRSALGAAASWPRWPATPNRTADR